MHSLRDFLVEIGTITIGILIALGLESLIEAHRNHELVDHARMDLRWELTANRQALVRTLSQQKLAVSALDQFARYAKAKLSDRQTAAPGTLAFSLDLTPMNTAAWESTVATQALAHMRYEETQALSRAYAGSRAYDIYQVEAVKHVYELYSLPDDLAGLSGADLKSALREVALNSAYEGSLLRTGNGLLRLYDKALAELG